MKTVWINHQLEIMANPEMEPPVKPSRTWNLGTPSREKGITIGLWTRYYNALQRYQEGCIKFEEPYKVVNSIIDADNTWHTWKCSCGCLNRRDCGTCARCRGPQEGFSIRYGDNEVIKPDTYLSIDIEWEVIHQIAIWDSPELWENVTEEVFKKYDNRVGFLYRRVLRITKPK